MSSSWLWLIVVLCAVVGVCGQEGGEEIEVVRAVKVLYLENALLEHAWTYRNDVARYLNAQEYKFQILTTAVITDEYDDDRTYRIVKEHIDDGYELIFFTSSGWANVAQVLAADFPDVNFVQNPGWNFTETTGLTNILAVDGLYSQGYYLAGILGGYMSKTNKIGMLNGQPVAVTIASINAFCIGARKVNPDIECYSITLGSWTDPRLHTQATRQLLDMDCDIVFALSGSLIPDEIVAEEYENGREVYSVGFANDFRVKVGQTVISSVVFFWDDVYSYPIRTHLEGNFAYGIVQPGMNGPWHSVDASPPSSLVPFEAYPLFLSERERLINAAPGEEFVFCGPEALEGLPDDIPLDDNGCMYQQDIQQMTYELAFVTPLEGEYYYNYIYLDSDNIIYPIMMAIISVVVIISFVYVAFILYYLPTAVIRVSSPVFCAVIIIGAWMQFSAAYLYLQEPTDSICMIPIWLEMVGFTMMLSAICVKNYRLYRMTRNTKKFFPVQISNFELLAALTLGVLGMIAILSAFQGIEPYVATTSTNPTELEVDELYLYCDTPEEGLFIGLIWGYLCIWLLSACILAYLTRRLEGVLCESSQLALAIYNIIIMELIFLPLIYTFDRDQYEGRTILLTLQPLYRGFATISIIFLPKFWLAAMYPERNTIKSSESRRTSALATAMDD